MLWIPRFDITLLLLIPSTLSDAWFVFLLFYHEVLGGLVTLLLFVALAITKLPIFIVGQYHFNRRLIWMGAGSALLSIVLVLVTNATMFITGKYFVLDIPATVGLICTPLVLFVHCWLIGNMLLLRVLLIRDVTLPSKLSLLMIQERVDELGDALPSYL